jgi:hypothetical protein
VLGAGETVLPGGKELRRTVELWATESTLLITSCLAIELLTTLADRLSKWLSLSFIVMAVGSDF